MCLLDMPLNANGLLSSGLSSIVFQSHTIPSAPFTNASTNLSHLNPFFFNNSDSSVISETPTTPFVLCAFIFAIN